MRKCAISLLYVWIVVTNNMSGEIVWSWNM